MKEELLEEHENPLPHSSLDVFPVKKEVRMEDSEREREKRRS